MATSDTQKNSVFLMIVGGLIAIGSFLPWVRAGIFSLPGTDGDGMLTLVGGAALLGIGALEGRSDFSRVRRVIAFLISALCVWIAWSVYDNVSEGGLDSQSVGGGLLLVLLASAAAAVATCFWMLGNEPGSEPSDMHEAPREDLL